MASGRLGTANLLATTITDVYTVPASTLTSLNVNICNRNNAVARIRIALSSVSVTQGNDEYIEFDTTIEAYGILERTAVLLGAGQILTVYSDIADLSVVATGIEETV